MLTIARIWRRILGQMRRSSRGGTNENLFAFGGFAALHSQPIRFASRIHRPGVQHIASSWRRDPAIIGGLNGLLAIALTAAVGYWVAHAVSQLLIVYPIAALGYRARIDPLPGFGAGMFARRMLMLPSREVLTYGIVIGLGAWIAWLTASKKWRLLTVLCIALAVGIWSCLPRVLSQTQDPGRFAFEKVVETILGQTFAAFCSVLAAILALGVLERKHYESKSNQPR